MSGVPCVVDGLVDVRVNSDDDVVESVNAIDDGENYWDVGVRVNGGDGPVSGIVCDAAALEVWKRKLFIV